MEQQHDTLSNNEPTTTLTPHACTPPPHTHMWMYIEIRMHMRASSRAHTDTTHTTHTTYCMAVAAVPVAKTVVSNHNGLPKRGK